MMLTKQQVQILQHAIGVKSGDVIPSINKAIRNFFGTGKKGKDVETCDSLVELNFMTRRDACSWMCDDYIYYVTKYGADALRNNAMEK